MQFRSLIFQRGLLMAAAIAATFQLKAGAVLINNPSFEAQVLAPGAFTDNVITGWVVGPSSGPVGAYNPNTFLQPVPDGSNTAYLDTNGMFYQDVGPLVANSTYVFDVFVGERTDLPLPAYNIQLLDASTSVVLDSAPPFPIPAGTFTKLQLMFHSANFASSVGDNIRIEFSVPSSAGQVNIDNVSLSFSPDTTSGVPEPSSFGFGLLGIGIMARAWMRREANHLATESVSSDRASSGRGVADPGSLRR